MIQRIQIYHSDSLDPYFNIATEKHLLDTVEEGCCILYLWQNKNTVVIGRNQNPWVECRTSLLEQEGGKLARRLSGGGAVFHDTGNLNFTFIMPDADYDLDRQLAVIQQACSFERIAVERSGRNDILAQGQKFSGNAFYHAQGKAYHHGTLLINADMDKLSRYLTPSKAKLEAKGVASVRSRVINLSSLAPSLTCERMRQHMADAFSLVYGLPAKAITLSETDQDQIRKCAATFESWQWLYGTRLPFSFACEDRFSWGSIRLELQVESGTVQAVQVYSDTMDWSLPDNIRDALTGQHFTLKDMTQALRTQLGDTDPCRDLCTLLQAQDL